MDGTAPPSAGHGTVGWLIHACWYFSNHPTPFSLRRAQGASPSRILDHSSGCALCAATAFFHPLLVVERFLIHRDFIYNLLNPMNILHQFRNQSLFGFVSSVTLQCHNSLVCSHIDLRRTG